MNKQPPAAFIAIAFFALTTLFLLPSPAQVQAGDSAPTPVLPDRLAEPTLPANPSPADLGAQAYWLNCMPCHGDKGQGLTEEFRELYPVEEQNCWDSGCHGARPYENGWTLPPRVPALVGPGALANFDDEAKLFGFIRATMPFSDPGSLDAETYQQLAAFLFRQNELLVVADLPGRPGTPEHQGSNRPFPVQVSIYIAVILILVVVLLVGVFVKHIPAFLAKPNKK
jgi:hypothetical protein